MDPARIRLGELLVEAGAITPEQLEAVLEQQKSDGRRLGTLLVEAGFVTEIQLTQILSQQLSVPWVSLYHIDFSRQLLDLVPKEIAERYGVVPIFVRRVRGLGNALYIAMEDPSDESALQAVQHYSGLPVRSMIAPPSDIRGAIRAYYQMGEELVPTSLPPPEIAIHRAARNSIKPTTEAGRPPQNPAPELRAVLPPETLTQPAAPVSIASANETSTPDTAQLVPALNEPETLRPEPKEAAPESGSHVPVREHSMPTPKRGRAHRRVTLTLLDGTKVTLPLRSQKTADPSSLAEAEMALTARDIVQALRAKLHGQNASEVLGEHDRWEGLFVALLSVLLKKQLIADWEFIDELKRL
jgi:type IV pilus assembly protein PilB